MQVAEWLADGRDQRHGLGEIEPAVLHRLRHGLALEPLHHEVRDALARRAVVDMTHHTRQARRRQDAGFALEALHVRGRQIAKDLDRDRALGVEIPAAEHLTDPTAADRAFDDKAIREQVPRAQVAMVSDLAATSWYDERRWIVGTGRSLRRPWRA